MRLVGSYFKMPTDREDISLLETGCFAMINGRLYHTPPFEENYPVEFPNINDGLEHMLFVTLRQSPKSKLYMTEFTVLENENDRAYITTPVGRRSMIKIFKGLIQANIGVEGTIAIAQGYNPKELIGNRD